MKLHTQFVLLIYTMITSISLAQESKILRIGHRGAMGHVSENTVASIKKAVDMQCDVIEIDVFVVKDGALMVFHDDNLERKTNGKGKIETYTKAELKKLLVDDQYEIPTLEEIIKTIDKKAVLNIELKGANTAEPTYKVIQAFKKKGWTNVDFIISSFRWDELEIMRKLDSQIDIAVLTEKEPTGAIEFAKQIKAVAINPYFKWLNAENVSKIKEANLKIYPWTVNENEDIKQLKELEVDGIITNFPERI